MNRIPLRAALAVLALLALIAGAAHAQDQKPNILVVWGDDIGQSNISAYTMGLVGYRTPKNYRIAQDRIIFTHYYDEHS